MLVQLDLGTLAEANRELERALSFIGERAEAGSPDVATVLVNMAEAERPGRS